MPQRLDLSTFPPNTDYRIIPHEGWSGRVMYLLQLREMFSWKTVDWSPSKEELENKAKALGFFKAAAITREAWFKEAEDKTLYENKHISIKETDDGYTYYEYDDTVGILPFRRNSHKPFLVRKEPVPSWGGGLFTWAVYGGTGDHGSIVEAAVAEVEEEAGFRISQKQLIDAGKIYRGKNSTGQTYLFLVDVTSEQQYEPQGDGSEEESDSLVQWVDANYIQYSECPILHSLLLKYYLSQGE